MSSSVNDLSLEGLAVLHENQAIDIRPYSTSEPTRRRVFMELWQARCVQGYVAVHLHSKIKLGDLARVTHFSQRKFNRMFKASFGCTPGQYIRRMRIARAQNLMTMSSDPLRRIAMECGFADQSHFSHCFRKVVGESPSIWRAKRCSNPGHPLLHNPPASPRATNQ
jgi:transcriptional regulator GlxA family with amidase domain